MKVVKKIIFAVVAILLIALLVGLAVYLVRGPGKKLAEEVKDALDTDFKVKYDGKTYKGVDNSVTLPLSGMAEFSIENFNTLKVGVSFAANFDFRVNNEMKHSKDIDLTEVFIKSENVFDNSFVIDCDSFAFDLHKVLRTLYGEEAEIRLPEISDEFIYKIVFTSNRDTIEIKFDFEVPDVELEMSAGVIVF